MTDNNAGNGIEVHQRALSNQITENHAIGNGGQYAGRYRFDLSDGNYDPVTSQPSCRTNVWFNTYATNDPACTGNGAHQLTPTAAPAARQASPKTAAVDAISASSPNPYPRSLR